MLRCACVPASVSWAAGSMGNNWSLSSIGNSPSREIILFSSSSFTQSLRPAWILGKSIETKSRLRRDASSQRRPARCSNSVHARLRRWAFLRSVERSHMLVIDSLLANVQEYFNHVGYQCWPVKRSQFLPREEPERRCWGKRRTINHFQQIYAHLVEGVFFPSRSHDWSFFIAVICPVGFPMFGNSF
ncbi:hypothetical protein BX600DRAFT_541828 [Xylariales sp. PMI_506]|nr:hypothetical protein BX600DRAFT_541828 [Xylariales sp. PMI_506]